MCGGRSVMAVTEVCTSLQSIDFPLFGPRIPIWFPCSLSPARTSAKTIDKVRSSLDNRRFSPLRGKAFP